MYALITGAALRLGKLCALQLADAGYDIILHYGRSEQDAITTSKELEALGANVKLWSCDLNDVQKVVQGLDELAQAQTYPNFIVHSASYFEGQAIHEHADSKSHIDFSQKTFQINLMTPIAMDQHFLNHWNITQLKDPESSTKEFSIVYFLDQRVNHHKGLRHLYSLSKKSLRDHMEQMSISYGTWIKINAIAPGLILPPPGMDASYLETLIHQAPMNTHGGAEDIQNAFDYLLKSKFVHGQIMYCDGGENLKG